MEAHSAAFAKRVADWVTSHQLLVYVVLGILAWALILLNYPLESLAPVYANF
jgi:low affinity Fe/Cu permease